MKKINLFILVTLFFLICSFSFATEKIKLHQPGISITTDTFKFSLNSMRWDSSDESFEPDPGMKYLVIDCTIQNISKNPVGISSLMMLALFDDEGYSQSQTIFANTKGALDGTLSPSQTMRGEVAFEVSANHSHWIFVYKPDWLSTDQYFYSISKEQIK